MESHHDTSKSAIVLDGLNVEQFLKLQQLIQCQSEMQEENINVVFLCMETIPPLSLATSRSIIAAALKSSKSSSSINAPSSAKARDTAAPASTSSSSSSSVSDGAASSPKAHRRSMSMKAIGSVRSSLKGKLGYSSTKLR
mmetsp:Transcript_24199/g.41426  ORF Transcript_24199/g.41426 Transcript_24199/m.41426 type:complete len:140 (+) Transcript_24199:193-612(+)|eukprot:CAMPEP_0183779154 /NCGR_PEP_ID=MMETSP0739-20130205/53271_1 /TAXON_ID=385413 /ORGANISM="Thalassiosira miniscula, Strain CCMP1093" /LENGTH=139 /DNA_ID=CAMNT_0026021737 /DNA_START=176 /DNA_END=595 /DNA_ORIENTATION=-